MPRVTAPADDLPSHIGRYQVLKRLGEGATSDVFLASDPFNDHKEVAIKRMRSWAPVPDAPSSDFSNRFFSAEAALAGQLHHPNVVAILDAVAEEAAPYLVMEYVPGVTLKHFCRSDRLLPLDQIVEVTFKCAMALGYVYRQGLIHRDVKPANLLAVVDASGQVVDVKVSDFGSALNLNADATQIHRVGSLAYMPPEQIDGGDVDCRADIYALGAVLYHLIGGRPPFDAPHQMALMHQIYHQPPLPLMGQREGVSEALDAVVQRALAKAPHERFPDWEVDEERAPPVAWLAAAAVLALALGVAFFAADRLTAASSASGIALLAAGWAVSGALLFRRARWEAPLGAAVTSIGHLGWGWALTLQVLSPHGLLDPWGVSTLVVSGLLSTVGLITLAVEHGEHVVTRELRTQGEGMRREGRAARRVDVHAGDMKRLRALFLHLVVIDDRVLAEHDFRDRIREIGAVAGTDIGFDDTRLAALAGDQQQPRMGHRRGIAG